MILRWHGHACFELQSDVTLVIDPHDGRSIGLSPPVASADLVLVSHDPAVLEQFDACADLEEINRAMQEVEV